MKVVNIGTESTIFDSRLLWPDATNYTATSIPEGIKLVEEATPDMVVLHLDSSGVPPGETLKKLRCLTAAPLLVLDHKKESLQAFVPTAKGEDTPIMLPPLPRRRRGARRAELPANGGG